MNKPNFVIIGAGISGLSLAHYLRKAVPFSKITILEKASQVGGVISSYHLQNKVFDMGPKTFRVSRSHNLLELIKDYQLLDKVRLSHPHASTRYIYRHKRLQKVPSKPLDIFSSSIFRKALPGLLREWKVKPYEAEDESIGAFIRRRFGNYIADTLFDPLSIGIYATDMHKLSVRTCFSALKEFEMQYGSITKALFKRKKNKKVSEFSFPKSALLTLEGGFDQLVKTIGNSFEDNLRLSCEVKGIQKLEGGYTVTTSEGDFIADHVFSALPLNALKKISLPLEEQKQLLCDFKTNSIISILLSFDTDVLKKKGFGYLIPSQEKQKILGVVYDSEIFPYQDHKTHVTVMMGGGICPELVDYNKTDLVKIALEELDKHLKIEEHPSDVHLRKYYHAIPEYPIYHLKKIDNLKRIIEKKCKGFHLVGNYIQNASVSSCIKSFKRTRREFQIAIKVCKYILCLMCMNVSSVASAKACRTLVVTSPEYIEGAGLFHNFTIVMGCLQLYEKHPYLGLKVDFGKLGLYYDKQKGDNWWNYYFEPLDLKPRGSR